MFVILISNMSYLFRTPKYSIISEFNASTKITKFKVLIYIYL